jgi:hypothetical protein
MPRKINTKIKEESQSEIPVEHKKVDVLLKAELHYFKGMSVFLMITMFCLFLAFGALFSAMYMETRMMRQAMEGVIYTVPVDMMTQ